MHVEFALCEDIAFNCRTVIAVDGSFVGTSRIQE